MTNVECIWERYHATQAPMATQRQQVVLCSCNSCRSARTLRAAIKGKHFTLTPRTAERLAVLQWTPEPPPQPDDVA